MSVTGYRVWRRGGRYSFNPAQGQPAGPPPERLLRALSQNVHWLPGGLTRARPCASCGTKSWQLDEFGIWREAGPLFGRANCRCGLHALIDPLDLRGYAEDLRFGYLVLGTVALGGKVMAHEKGYRAELGRVSALYYIRSIQPADSGALKRAAGNEKAARYVEEHGPDYSGPLRVLADTYGVPLHAIEDQPWGEAWMESIAATL